MGVVNFVFEFSFTYWLAAGLVFALLASAVLLNEFFSDRTVMAYMDHLYTKRSGSTFARISIKLACIVVISLLWKPVAIVVLAIFGLCASLVLLFLVVEWVFPKPTLEPKDKHAKPFQ